MESIINSQNMLYRIVVMVWIRINVCSSGVFLFRIKKSSGHDDIVHMVRKFMVLT